MNYTHRRGAISNSLAVTTTKFQKSQYHEMK